MTKYSNEFKVKANKMVLKGNSISHVAKILNMPDIAPLCRWISHYEHCGIPQLLHKNRKYTPIFKQKVIEYKWLHHLSLNQTAAKFSIPKKEFSYVEQLEQENYQLRMENDLLKK